MVVEVIINRSAKKLNRTFDYNVPKEFEELILIGSKVLVPFGRSKKLEEAYVVSIKETSTYKIKDIAEVKNNLNSYQIELAKWIAKKYFCNLSDAIKLMLAPGTKNKKNIAHEKKINCVYLKKDEETIKFEIETQILKSEKQKKVLQFVQDNPACTIPEIEMFTGYSRGIYIEICEKKIERNPLTHKKIEKTQKLELTEEQKNAYNLIANSMQQNKHEQFLLYGVTGSGKTEIYLQLIERALSKEKTSLVLVPEISLTPQMLDRFISRFGKEKIAVLHSKLSIGERYDEWNRIKAGEAKIVIGARSAIFAPISNLGIVIIDEEHDTSYKSEMNPKYNAKEVAKKISEDAQVPLIYGSATPDINTYYKTEQGNITLLKLTKRANDSKLPNVEVIDLKQELANGNRTMLSVKLHSLIEENLKNKRQTILFLNSRGYSTFVMCRNCGYVVQCPNCNISLTYHKYQNKLKCHYCGHEEKIATICPNCRSDKIKYFGAGTQKLEQEINKFFPKATTIRMDIDTVSKKNSHEDILNKFKNDGIDILIGTQMVVKGHHFPNVTLVGVLAADSSLNIDDYRASERTFQILTQVAGRAGRENIKGKVIIQTYNPENYSIECAKKQDFDLFYKTEILLRKQLKYPPFCDIIVISFNSLIEDEIKKTANFAHSFLKKELNEEQFRILKPMPCPIDKIQGRYRWRIIVKGNMTSEANSVFNKCLQKVYGLNLKSTRIGIDINPINMM